MLCILFNHINFIKMKVQLFISLAIMFYSITSQAQQKNKKEISPAGIHVVVIKANDRAFIKKSSENKINVTSYLFTEGDIWGYRSPGIRQKFEIKHRFSNDTLYISSPEKYSPMVIGIKTYSEKVETNFEIPEDIEVIVSKAYNLIIESFFEKMTVLKADYIDIKGIKKQELFKLKSKTSEKLTINGEIRSNEFEIIGTGNKSVLLNSKEIQISIN